MRLSDLYFFLIPTPAALASFFAQHQWLTAVLVAAVMMVLGVFVRLGHVIVKEIQGNGLRPWREEGEEFRDSRVLHRQKRQMSKLEGDQQRREFKRRSSSSWWDQWRFRL